MIKKTQKILITGSCGFIGFHLSKKLIGLGFAVIGVDNVNDYYDPNLYYVDPMEVLNFCKQELQGHPVLRHDYSVRREGYPFEFAIYVYKKPQYFGSEKQI